MILLSRMFMSENDWKSQSTKRETLFASKICAYSFSVGHFLMGIDFSNLFLSFIPSFSIYFSLYIYIYIESLIVRF